VKAVTHLAFAGVCAVIAQGMGHTLEPASLVALGLGAILPDIDTSTSSIGQLVPAFSSRIERRFGHRTITHSLLGVMTLAIVSSPLILWNSSVFGFLLLGFISHLILDTFNISGVPLLWPARTVFWFFPHRAYRVAYNSPLEKFILVSCLLACVAVIPFSSIGFSNSFHKFLGTPSGVVSDYLEWRDSFEVFAEVDGFNVETQEKIHGKYRVVDAIGKEGVIVEDESGDALGMGLARGAQVSVYHVAAFKTQAIQSKEYRLELEGEPLEHLLSRLPKAKTASNRHRPRLAGILAFAHSGKRSRSGVRDHPISRACRMQ
jgi:inner membrane protein